MEAGEVETLFAVPSEYQPAQWAGKFKHPVVMAELCLYGHPKAGDWLEQRMCYCSGEANFEKASQWPSVFKYSEYSNP